MSCSIGLRGSMPLSDQVESKERPQSPQMWHLLVLTQPSVSTEEPITTTRITRSLSPRC